MLLWWGYKFLFWVAKVLKHVHIKIKRFANKAEKNFFQICSLNSSWQSWSEECETIRRSLEEKFLDNYICVKRVIINPREPK